MQYCWENATVPENMTKANIISLYKKGDPTKPENYSPIARLNMYKIYTIILWERIRPTDRDKYNRFLRLGSTWVRGPS